MRNRIYILGCLATWIIIISCGSRSTEEQNSIIPDSVHAPKKIEVKLVYAVVRDHTTLDTFVVGNFDKDRIIDTAFLYGPLDSLHWDMFDCWPCSTYIMLNNGTKVYGSEQEVFSFLENVGDLDNDGIDEIGHITGWFMGSWSYLMIMKNVNGEWKEAAFTEIMYPLETFKMKNNIRKKGNGKILLYGEHHIFPELTEKVFDLKADSLPCLVSEKKFEY